MCWALIHTTNISIKRTCVKSYITFPGIQPKLLARSCQCSPAPNRCDYSHSVHYSHFTEHWRGPLINVMMIKLRSIFEASKRDLYDYSTSPMPLAVTCPAKPLGQTSFSMHSTCLSYKCHQVKYLVAKEKPIRIPRDRVYVYCVIKHMWNVRQLVNCTRSELNVQLVITWPDVAGEGQPNFPETSLPVMLQTNK